MEMQHQTMKTVKTRLLKEVFALNLPTAVCTGNHFDAVVQ